MAKKDWMVNGSDLDDDQLLVLNTILDKSLIVSGCAGSGKSVLALRKAERIQKERGNDYKIIVYTKALCRYMNDGKKALGLKNSFNYHWDWKHKLGCPSADYIIVDEIQDFTKQEVQEFISATRKNFFFFGDTAQSIYEDLKRAEGGTLPVERIDSLLSHTQTVKKFELYRNYRLPLPVARIAQYVGVDLDNFNESIYKSREKALPKFIQYPDLQKQIEAIVRILKNKPEWTDVGILLPTNENAIEVHRMLNSLNLSHEVKYNDKADWRASHDDLNFNTTNPKVMTYHSAKGLQFQTVFLPNVSAYGHGGRKALYVAMTRTYRDLYVMYSGSLPAPLNTIPSDLYQTTETDSIIVDF